MNPVAFRATVKALQECKRRSGVGREIYAEFCESCIREVSAKLGRPLTDAEQIGIWAARSLLMLEVIERDIVACPDAEAAEAALADALRPPTARPDPSAGR